MLHPQPEPDLFLHAARQLGAEPGRTTGVEASSTGIMVARAARAARAAGLRSIGFAAMTPAAKRHAAAADAVVHTLAELQTLLLSSVLRGARCARSAAQRPLDQARSRRSAALWMLAFSSA